jgi:phenylalanine-4-hydroxylase
MRTKYAIGDFQQTVVIKSFKNLLPACYEDFGSLYERPAAATDIEPFELIEGDDVLTRGTLAFCTLSWADGFSCGRLSRRSRP